MKRPHPIDTPLLIIDPSLNNNNNKVEATVHLPSPKKTPSPRAATGRSRRRMEPSAKKDTLKLLCLAVLVLLLFIAAVWFFFYIISLLSSSSSDASTTPIPVTSTSTTTEDASDTARPSARVSTEGPLRFLHSEFSPKIFTRRAGLDYEKNSSYAHLTFPVLVAANSTEEFRLKALHIASWTVGVGMHRKSVSDVWHEYDPETQPYRKKLFLVPLVRALITEREYPGVKRCYNESIGSYSFIVTLDIDLTVEYKKDEEEKTSSEEEEELPPVQSYSYPVSLCCSQNCSHWTEDLPPADEIKPISTRVKYFSGEYRKRR